MALPDIFPKNEWAMNGTLGGFMGGVGASYGMGAMDDANRLRDLEDKIKNNELDEALLDKPNKAAKRAFELESELPTKSAKNATDLEWNTSGKALKDKDADLETKGLNNKKTQLATEALERGQWLEEAQPFFDPKNSGQLGMQESWKEHLKKKPKHLTYIQDGPLTPETVVRGQQAWQAYIKNGPHVRAMLQQDDSQAHAVGMETTRQEGLDKRAKLTAETSTANAAIRAKAPNAGDLAMRKISKFAQTGVDDPNDPLTLHDVAAVEQMLQKNGNKEADAIKVENLLTMLQNRKDWKTMSSSERLDYHKSVVRSTYPPESRRQLELAEKALGVTPPPPLPADLTTPAKPEEKKKQIPGSTPNPAKEATKKQVDQGKIMKDGAEIGTWVKFADGEIKKTYTNGQ